MVDREFGERLELVLKALTLSNGRVAADLAIDKSLVGRWVAGKVVPSAHNLTRLTTYLAQRIPGFSMLDWDRPSEALRQRLIGEAPDRGAIQAIPCPDSSLEETRRSAARYAGRWAMWRLDITDLCTVREGVEIRHVQDQLQATITVGDVQLHGFARVHRNRFLIWLCDELYGPVCNIMLSGLALPSERMMSGTAMGIAYDGAFTPFAQAVVFERLTDDRPDAEWLAECRAQDRIVDEALVPPEIRAALRPADPPSPILRGGAIASSRAAWRRD